MTASQKSVAERNPADPHDLLGRFVGMSKNRDRAAAHVRKMAKALDFLGGQPTGHANGQLFRDLPLIHDALIASIHALKLLDKKP